MGRPFDLLVGFAALLSALLVAVMLAAPLLPQPSTAADVASPSPTASPTAVPEGDTPPIGLYLLRGQFSFGPCLAMNLSPESYPVDPEQDGTATVTWWQRGMTGCDSRTGELQPVDATVSPVFPEDAGPGDELIGYAVRFSLPAAAGVAVSIEITILADQSTQDLVQALETSSPGSFGLVFDRVEIVDPPEDPLPATPTPALSPQPSP